MLQVVKTYKYKLRNLSATQTQSLNSWIGACRFVYNLALETKQYAYKVYGVNVSCYDLEKDLKTLKDVEWIKAVPSQSLQDVIQRLEKAYQSFFSGAGFPKWANFKIPVYRGKGKYNSITLKSIHREKCEQGRFVLPKLGEIKTFYSREIPKEAKLKRATIIKLKIPQGGGI